MTTIPVEKLLHVNQVLDDFDAANHFYEDVFGAEIYMNSYHEAEERDASLFVIGDTCIELFSPRTATSLLGRNLARYGNSWHSFEWKVPDLEAAKTALEERGVRLGSYYAGSFLMTHPKDTHGMLLEMCPSEMANDPRLAPGWSADRWRTDHPLGIRGLNALGVAVRDLGAAGTFLEGLVGAHEVLRRDRDRIGARSAAFRVADHVIELNQPEGEGVLASFVDQFGPRLRSIELEVESVARAASYLEEKGVGVIEGDDEGTIALDPGDNYGVRYQLSEQNPFGR
ncbi:MAG TPA: VOC family protein [Acidimicrobiales bacterium]|jgi:catechol 2,3-dioxygenase-like lactoylglutathione lyase family enzyme